MDAHTVEVTGSDGTKTRYTADKIVIAMGGRPHFPPGEGIEEHCISSDGFFELESLPKVAVVVGAGYIAVGEFGDHFLLFVPPHTISFVSTKMNITPTKTRPRCLLFGTMGIRIGFLQI